MNLSKNSRLRDRARYAVSFVLGSFVFALGFNAFLLPHEIVLGGATGVATVLKIFTGIPVGVSTLLVNLPIVIFYAVTFGARRIGAALAGIVSTSVAVDLLFFLPSVTEDPLIASLFGGAIMGIGVGILFRIGITTGGSDLAAYIIHQKNKKMTVGLTVLAIDGAIILASALALGDFGGILYSVATAVTYSVAIDRTILGANRAKLVYIVSGSPEPLADRIILELGRGVTLLYGKGKYTDTDRRIIMCAVKRQQLYRLKSLVSTFDPAAFMIITDANEVFGEGFGNNNS